MNYEAFTLAVYRISSFFVFTLLLYSLVDYVQMKMSQKDLQYSSNKKKRKEKTHGDLFKKFARQIDRQSLPYMPSRAVGQCKYAGQVVIQAKVLFHSCQTFEQAYFQRLCLVCSSWSLFVCQLWENNFLVRGGIRHFPPAHKSAIQNMYIGSKKV